MICNRCLRAATRPLDSIRIPRQISAATRLSYSTTSPLFSQPPPAATSSAAAQPFSEPLTPSNPKQKKDKTPKRPLSSIKAGTKLKGLNLLKGKEDPVALEDHEYPDWLWTLLEPKGNAANAGADAEGDLYAKSAKQRRKAAKALRKREALMAGKHIEPPVPVQEQSVDLPVGGAGVAANIAAAEARGEITKALRQKRRAGIKEANFLKGVS